MGDYIYPARPGMLRVGTPAIEEDSEIVVLNVEDALVADRETGVSGEACLPCVALDLRDPTSRAHAAMLYTTVSSFGNVVLAALPWNDSIWQPEDEHGPDDRLLTQEAERHFRILARMRMLDESVTVEEARAALDWAYCMSRGR